MWGNAWLLLSAQCYRLILKWFEGSEYLYKLLMTTSVCTWTCVKLNWQKQSFHYRNGVHLKNCIKRIIIMKRYYINNKHKLVLGTSSESFMFHKIIIWICLNIMTKTISCLSLLYHWHNSGLWNVDNKIV